MITEDIKPEWLPVIHNIKSKCDDNNGFALIEVNFPVYKDLPVAPHISQDSNGASPGTGWLSVIRHIQAICSKNDGLSLFSIKIVVLKNEPKLWQEAHLMPMDVEVGLKKIRPMRIKGLHNSSDIMAAVSCFLPAVLD